MNHADSTRTELNTLADRIYAELQFHLQGITVAASDRFYFYPTDHEQNHKASEIICRFPNGTPRGKIYGDLFKLCSEKQDGVRIPTSLSRYSNIIKLGYADD